MLRYRDIEDLPADHPLVAAFLDQERQREHLLAEAGPMTVGPEGSHDHFDRFVAGDR